LGPLPPFGAQTINNNIGVMHVADRDGMSVFTNDLDGASNR